MGEIENILSEQQEGKYEGAIRQLSDDGLKELFRALGNGNRSVDFKKITIIAEELYRRNTRRFAYGARLQDIAFLGQFIEKDTKDYIEFLERMKKAQVAGISAYLLYGQEYTLYEGFVGREKEWLDNNQRYSWKDLLLLTSYCVSMNEILQY